MKIFIFLFHTRLHIQNSKGDLLQSFEDPKVDFVEINDMILGVIQSSEFASAQGANKKLGDNIWIFICERYVLKIKKINAIFLKSTMIKKLYLKLDYLI